MTAYVVSAGVTSSGLTLSAGDTLSVLNGGTATNITVNNGGIETISFGGVASGTVVNSGGIVDDRYTFAQGFGSGLKGTKVNSGGILEFGSVHSGGTTTASLNTSTDVLTITSGPTSGTLTLAGTYASGATTASSYGGGKFEVVFSCYEGGTEILTDRGEVPVESLSPGDIVVVRRNGRDVQEPVTWVGSSSIDLSRHAQPELAAPIRFKAGAIAENNPARDLVLSPEHCLVISGRCVPAKLLVNGGSIAREYRKQPFEYYHVELAKHGILIAAGTEAESYLDTGNRRSFDNADAPQMLHPTFEVNATSDRWKTEACAPLASIKDEVVPIWQTLADRSIALGYETPMPETVEDPDLHILADGLCIQPVSDRDARYIFTVPAGVKSVSLMSRFCIPADKMVSNLRDTRRLGVSVNWIAIRSHDSEVVLSADHPELGDGWNDAEQVGSTMWRWTDGAATIPWECSSSSVIVTVCCTPVDQYPVYAEPLALVA